MSLVISEQVDSLFVWETSGGHSHLTLISMLPTLAEERMIGLPTRDGKM